MHEQGPRGRVGLHLALHRVDQFQSYLHPGIFVCPRAGHMTPVPCCIWPSQMSDQTECYLVPCQRIPRVADQHRRSFHYMILDHWRVVIPLGWRRAVKTFRIPHGRWWKLNPHLLLTDSRTLRRGKLYCYSKRIVRHVVLRFCLHLKRLFA